MVLPLLAQVVTTFCFRMASESTGYSRKRRLLRRHREQMRVMEDLICDHGLRADLDLRMVYETGNTPFWLGRTLTMDEDSDAPDPEEELRAENEMLRREARESRALVDAAAAMADCEILRQELERARMAREDLVSRAGAEAAVLGEVLREQIAEVERPAVLGEQAELEGGAGHPVPNRPAVLTDSVVSPAHPRLEEGL